MKIPCQSQSWKGLKHLDCGNDLMSKNHYDTKLIWRIIVSFTNWKSWYDCELRLNNCNPQLTFICSKSAVETLEKGVKICSKLTIKTPEERYWRRSGGYTVYFEHISHLFPVFVFLILNKQMLARCIWLSYY